MDTDDINGCTLNRAVREIFNATKALRARNTTADNGNIGLVQPDVELEVVGNVTEPAFASRNGPNTAERLVLEINALRWSDFES